MSPDGGPQRITTPGAAASTGTGGGADAWGSRGQAGGDVSSAQSRGTCPCEFHRPVPREALAANPGDGAPATASRDRDGTPGTRPEALPPGTETALAAPQLPGLSRARPSVSPAKREDGGAPSQPVLVCHPTPGDSAALPHPTERVKSGEAFPSLPAQGPGSLPHADRRGSASCPVLPIRLPRNNSRPRWKQSTQQRSRSSLDQTRGRREQHARDRDWG